MHTPAVLYTQLCRTLSCAAHSAVPHTQLSYAMSCRMGFVGWTCFPSACRLDVHFFCTGRHRRGSPPPSCATLPSLKHHICPPQAQDFPPSGPASTVEHYLCHATSVHKDTVRDSTTTLVSLHNGNAANHSCPSIMPTRHPLQDGALWHHLMMAPCGTT